jgi:hypothetical protein
MSDTLILVRPFEAPTPLPSRLPPPRGRKFAEVLHDPKPVVEVLAAVATDFRQGEASMLSIINAALAKDCMTKAQLHQLKARMNRYSFEVDALTKLIEALVSGLKRTETRAA